jgi:hypothetical protein
VKELSDAHKMMFNSLAMPDERSFGVFNMLKDIYPAFTDKLFEGNDIMRRLVMSGLNPMDILDYPICGKCETIAPYSGYVKRGDKLVGKCTCMKEKCNYTTVSPVTLRAWLRDEMKKKVPEDFYDAIEYAVDGIAASLMLKQIRDSKEIMQKKRASDCKSMGIVLSDGSEYEFSSKPEIKHLRNEVPNAPKGAIEIQDELEDL